MYRPLLSQLRLLWQIERAAREVGREMDLDGPEPSAEPEKATGYVSIVEAARHFGVSAHTVRRRVLSREWPSVRIGRQIRIDVDAITRSRRRAGS